MLRIYQLIQIPVLLLFISVSGCSPKKASGSIGKEDMFPPPSVFSGECEVDESLADEVAVKIAKGVYEDSGVRTASDSNIVHCWYKNPKLTLTVSHFEDAKSCDAAHLKDGIGVARTLKGFQEFDQIGEDGYLTDFGGENFGFRYGNLSVVVNLYAKADRDHIIESLKSHYKSVSN
ncbi:MAG: hypothetical protein ACI9UA_002317 [Pseudoalteromonas tetraodonis]|jgi:hypothetical protein